MRLYVHFEATDEADAWTKRLNLPLVDDPSACPSVRSVLQCFFSAYTAKFRPKRPLQLSEVDVYLEYTQNASSRRLLTSLDQSVALVGGSRCQSTAQTHETCDFELVVAPKSPQRKVLGPEPPPKVKPTKCNLHPETRTLEQDPKLKKVLQLAAANMKLNKFCTARELYKTVVLAAEPQNAEALLALGNISMANEQYEEAAGHFLKCWRAHGCDGEWKSNENKQVTCLAFTSALRLAECYVEMHKNNRAVKTLDELQGFMRVNSGTNFSAQDKVWMETQMYVLKAQALYDTKNLGKQDEAIALIMHLLPDLQAPVLNLQALLLYAKITYARGRKSEALGMALRVLVGKSDDRGVKKALVGMLEDADAMERLQQAVPPTAPPAGAAYAFIATILKDYGAIDNCICCFRHAQFSNPQSASYALNHAHALEVKICYYEAYDVLVSFFRQNRALSIGNGANGISSLSAGSFVDILDQAGVWKGNDSVQEEDAKEADSARCYHINWISGNDEHYAQVTLNSQLDKQPERTNELLSGVLPALPEAELDLLACFFTIVKILFITGRLSAIPPLIRVLEPQRIGRKLHLTTIRNEQAYYTCIAQLLSIQDALELHPPQGPSNSSPDTVYVCGDSHTLATSWRRITLHGKRRLLRPALVTGLKHWHLRKETTFYPKLNFWHVIASIPLKSRVIFLFGEIDCREGILDAVEKCKYESIEEGMEHTIDIFMEALADVVDKFSFEVYIHPVVPVLDETRAMVIQYNNIFQKRVTTSGICKWLDFFDELVYQNPPKLRPELRLDGTHLHPSYLLKLEAALDEQCPQDMEIEE